jgi:hypothetical protein
VVRSCVTCTAQTADGYLCNHCTDRLARDLAAVPKLCVELNVTLSRTDKIAVSPGRGGDAGLPYSVAASTALVALDSTVAYWARQVQAEGETLPAETDLIAQWLGQRCNRLRADLAADDAYVQIRSAVTRAWGVVDHPSDRARVRVGPCVCDDHDGPCPGTVVAHIPAAEDQPASMRCDHHECSASWGAASWTRIGRAIMRKMARSVA